MMLVLLGTLTVVRAAGAAPAYPVKVGPTGRYLVDQQGVPFLMAGESPQAMIGNLSEADAELFFVNRQAHGFNTVLVDLLCASYTGCRSDGSTFDGILPFTGNDFSTPNESYFARADRVLQLAAKHGFLVLLDPAETGSWLSVMQSNGVAKCRAYGQFLGQRYAGFDNIIWLHGNDYGLPHADHDAANDALVSAIALGIKDVDARHLHTVQFNTARDLPPVMSTDDPRWIPIIDLNAAYTYQATYVEVLAAYNYSPILPTFLVESRYEFEDIAVLGSAPRNLRAQAYWALLSGATGQLYGNTYTWRFIGGWKEQLDSPGAVQMAYVTVLFGSRPWHDLVPDQSHTVVTGGFGTFGSGDYATAAMTPAGTLAMVYVPSARTVTVDLSRLSGPVTAQWYDPAAGTFTPISGSPFANSGSRALTTPGDNADGDEDWLLVLEVLAQTPSLNVRVNKSTFHSGDSFQLDLLAANPGPETEVDFYLGALLPATSPPGPGLNCANGDPIVFFGESSTAVMTCLSASPMNAAPFARNIVLPAGLPITTVDNLLNFIWLPDLPVGFYTFFAAFTRAGAMEVRALDAANVTFEP